MTDSPAQADDDPLEAGYRRFREDYFEKNRDLFRELAELGQAPHTCVVACADSRVQPPILFDAGPGELFVVRNVANIVPPCDTAGAYAGTSAALEFAVTGLKVRTILVLGHSQCGGVGAFVQGMQQGGRRDRAPDSFVGRWMHVLEEAWDRLPEEARRQEAAALQRRMEEEGIRASLRNLETFPFVADAVAAGRLALRGAHFDIGSGELRFL